MSRLEQRVRWLEKGKGGRRLVMIVVKVSETEEDAKARHFAKHPEDRDAGDILIVQIVDPTV